MKTLVAIEIVTENQSEADALVESLAKELEWVFRYETRRATRDEIRELTVVPRGLAIRKVTASS